MRPPSPLSEMDFVEYLPSPSSEQDFAMQSPSSPSKQGFCRTVTELTEQTGISPCCHRAYRVDRDFAAHWPSASSRSSPSNAQQAGKNHRVRFFFADVYVEAESSLRGKRVPMDGTAPQRAEHPHHQQQVQTPRRDMTPTTDIMVKQPEHHQVWQKSTHKRSTTKKHLETLQTP